VPLDPVQHRQVRRGVVELDVAVEGRAPREDRRRAVGEVGGESSCRAPWVDGQHAARGEAEPDHGERDNERRREHRRPLGERRELRRDDDEREAGGEKERPRQGHASRQLQQEAGAER
jgi:hypothetical protein